MSTQHTPGPWRWVNKGNHFELESAGGHTVADDGSASGEYGRWFSTPDGTPDANARLIAAAPELLEALIDVSKNVKSDSPEMWGARRRRDR